MLNGNLTTYHMGPSQARNFMSQRSRYYSLFFVIPQPPFFSIENRRRGSAARPSYAKATTSLIAFCRHQVLLTVQQSILRLPRELQTGPHHVVPYRQLESSINPTEMENFNKQATKQNEHRKSSSRSCVHKSFFQDNHHVSLSNQIRCSSSYDSQSSVGATAKARDRRLPHQLSRQSKSLLGNVVIRFPLLKSFCNDFRMYLQTN